MNTELCWFSSFLLYRFFRYCSKSQLIFLEFVKNMIKPPLIWLMYLTLKANFRIMLRLMISNCCVPLLNILHKDLCQWVILTPFSPFYIKCKKVNVKNLWKCILRHLGGWLFHIFPRLHSIMWGGGVNLDIFWSFCESCHNIHFKPYAASKMEFFVTKNRWWLKTVVDCCCVELHLKC